MPYKGGKRPRAQLQYSEEIYTPYGAKNLTEKELKKEYSRLRSIARKRLERFEGTEWTTSQIYKQFKKGFPTVKELGTDAQLRNLRFALTDVARFVTTKTASVSGLEKQRAQAVETLGERGYDFVTKKNFRKFAEFMEYARMKNLHRIYDSKAMANFYGDIDKKDQYTKQEIHDAFKSWQRNQRKLAKVQNRSKKGSGQFRRALD